MTTADGISGDGLNAKIDGGADGARVDGALVFGTVAEVADVLRAASESSGTLDLSGAKRIDSAGIALILDVVIAARRAGRRLEVVGIPAEVSSLLRIYGLDEVMSGPAG